MLPTPTPLPPGAPMVTLNAGNYRIWQFTDEAIQVWNFDRNLGLMIQVGILVLIVIVFVAMMIHLLQNTMSEE
jgi:hypothetical protein